jgi:hypothetical protein
MRVLAMTGGDTPNGTGIGELRRRQPADETMRNLLELTSEKLDLCGRLPVYELEAANEGHAATARLFSELADVERASFDALKARLVIEIDESSRHSGEDPSKRRRR